MVSELCRDHRLRSAAPGLRLRGPTKLPGCACPRSGEPPRGQCVVLAPGRSARTVVPVTLLRTPDPEQLVVLATGPSAGFAPSIVNEVVCRSPRPYLVVVAGPPGSGKSTLADLLAAQLIDVGLGVARVDHDEFLRPRRERETLRQERYPAGPFAGRTHYQVLENYFRLDEFSAAVSSLRAHQPTTIVPYARSTGELSLTPRVVTPADVILFDSSELVELMDFVVRIDVTPDLLLARKLVRDAAIRPPEAIFEMHAVQCDHWARVAPRAPDLVVENDDPSRATLFARRPS